MPGAIRNPKVRAHMDELFGKEGVDALRELLPTLKTPAEREQAILTALEASMNSIGGRYVQTFRFRDEHNNVSHHLVFVTKNATAHFIMKQIMAKHSSGFVDEVANFEFISNAQPALFATDAPIETLMDDLLKRFRGQTISIEKIMEEHQYGTPYIPRNYQEALRRLCYDRKLIKAVRGPHSPVLEPEKRHMPVQNTYITFP
jgi:hypothetical protein